MQLKFLPILLLQETNKIRSFQAASHILEEVEMVMILLMIDLLTCHIGNNIFMLWKHYIYLFMFMFSLPEHAMLRVSFGYQDVHLRTSGRHSSFYLFTL